jgi:hypothetical protein
MQKAAFRDKNHVLIIPVSGFARVDIWPSSLRDGIALLIVPITKCETVGRNQGPEIDKSEIFDHKST